VDRRVVQLSDRQNHGGSSRTSEEYRECKSVIPVDINDIVNDVLNLSRGELRSRKIALSTNLAAGLPKIHADPVQLREVLLNLIINGAKAMNATAAHLRVLAIASKLETDGVTITVEDSGTGIDAKHAEQVFEAFFTTKPTRMGMGLAICRSIIAAHNGRLWASPGASSGTVFYVALLRSIRVRSAGLG
jgi:signal transduction histidine kinase